MKDLADTEEKLRKRLLGELVRNWASLLKVVILCIWAENLTSPYFVAV